jgi:hypothetical protein
MKKLLLGLTLLSSVHLFAASHGKIDMFNNVDLMDLSFETTCSGYFCNDHGMYINIGNEQSKFYIKGMKTYDEEYIQSVVDRLNAKIEEMEERCAVTGRVDIEAANNRANVNPNTINLTCSIL